MWKNLLAMFKDRRPQPRHRATPGRKLARLTLVEAFQGLTIGQLLTVVDQGQLPVDLSDEDGRRAMQALRGLAAYVEAAGIHPVEPAVTVMTDLMTDLQHLAVGANVDFWAALEDSLTHSSVELVGH